MLAPSVTTTSSSPLSVLAIAGRAGHAFTPQAMMQGFACHAKGVELVAAGDARVHARVRSKRIHDVLLRAEEGRLVVACTCPARSLGIDFCKHAWAALLEIDRQDALAALRCSNGPLQVDIATPPPATKKTSAAREARAEPLTKKRSAPSKTADTAKLATRAKKRR